MNITPRVHVLEAKAVNRARVFARLLFSGWLAAAGVAARDARADGAADSATSSTLVGRLTDEGMALYTAHDYRHAVEKFIAAYAVDPDPNLLFNAARCYELLGDARSAIDKYEAFLAEPTGDPNGRHKAEEALAALRKSEATPAPPKTTPAGPSRPGGSPPWSVLGWLSLGVGVAAGAVGTVLFLSGTSDEDQVTGTPGFGQASKGQIANITQANAQDLIDRSNTKKTVGEVLWGVGGAGLGGAAIFFLLNRSPSESSVSVGVAPSTSGVSLSVSGRF